MIRVQVACAAGLFRSALVALLRGEEGLAVTCEEAAAGSRAADCPPVDVRVADAETLAPRPRATTSGVRGGGAPEGVGLLVLANVNRPGVLRRAFDAGALGYVDKQGSPGRLVEGIHAVARGERYVDESLAVGLLRATEIPLTPRELGVLALAAQGACVAEIALDLHLSRGTVRNYLAAAIRKTGARNRVDAIRIAGAAGWM
ncbi:response regulator transcription factor [Streptomyces finlayi]|uniref:response regulator transcription factor n=1 Tax=Streptomyces finlayi TaxID=67296 RepID=UPI00167A4804|nr:response regulator transcription factor [Streptomyces finlayi]